MHIVECALFMRIPADTNRKTDLPMPTIIVTDKIIHAVYTLRIHAWIHQRFLLRNSVELNMQCHSFCAKYTTRCSEQTAQGHTLPLGYCYYSVHGTPHM